MDKLGETYEGSAVGNWQPELLITETVGEESWLFDQRLSVTTLLAHGSTYAASRVNGLGSVKDLGIY